jgi:hypothetical protein
MISELILYGQFLVGVVNASPVMVAHLQFDNNLLVSTIISFLVSKLGIIVYEMFGIVLAMLNHETQIDLRTMQRY